MNHLQCLIEMLEGFFQDSIFKNRIIVLEQQYYHLLETGQTCFLIEIIKILSLEQRLDWSARSPFKILGVSEPLAPQLDKTHCTAAFLGIFPMGLVGKGNLCEHEAPALCCTVRDKVICLWPRSLLSSASSHETGRQTCELGRRWILTLHRFGRSIKL